MKFASFRNARVVRSGWLEEGGRRLDCNPYMSGALEARDALKALSARKEPLHSLTAGHAGGIYNGPIFARHWVVDPQYGVPFLGSSDMSNADLSTLPLLKKGYAQSLRLRHLELRPGTTLITCSGTIGRMTYVRPDMVGMWSSQHIMKVVPNESKVPPGYLYAFLSSKYGVPLVVAGTYGAIIQHIEPEHIANLPVPRLGNDFELHVSGLILKAAEQRALASHNRRAAIAAFETLLCWKRLEIHCLFRAASSADVLRRMDAFYHSAKVAQGIEALSRLHSVRLAEKVERVFEPNRGARLKVDHRDYGVPFLSSSAVFEVHPKGEYLISRSRTPHFDSLLLSSRDVLLPRSGQLGGIIGRAALPLIDNVGNAGSEHLVRVRCRSDEDAAYLWAVLASEPGYWAIVGTAYGSSIPSLDTTLIAEINIPWFNPLDRSRISSLARDAIEAQSRGIVYESEAIRMVEQEIGENG